MHRILRFCAVILRDETGAPVATPEYAVALVQKACDLYKRDANVSIGVAAGVAIVGKLSGRVRADHRLKQRVREIQAEWQRPRTEGETWSYG